MSDVVVKVTRIQCAKLPACEKGSETVFDVNASLREASRDPGVLTLDFDIIFDTEPPIARISLAGSAIINGNEEEIRDLTDLENQDSTPEIFMRIYEKVYVTLYLLSGTIGMPYPTPGLLKTTCLYSDSGISRPLIPVLVEKSVGGRVV